MATGPVFPLFSAPASPFFHLHPSHPVFDPSPFSLKINSPSHPLRFPSGTSYVFLMYFLCISYVFLMF